MEIEDEIKEMRISPACSIEEMEPDEEIVLKSMKSQGMRNYQTGITAKTKEDEEIYYQVTTTPNNCPDEFITNPLSEEEDSRSAKEEYQTKKLITPVLMKTIDFTKPGGGA